MAIAITASSKRLASYTVSNLGGMTLEAEIRSLHSLEPDNVRQLPALFAQSVVESCSAMAGTSSGEALIRRIGDDNLHCPEEVFRRIDALLGGGSDTLKKAIEMRFRSKVHRLYRISMSLEAKQLSSL